VGKRLKKENTRKAVIGARWVRQKVGVETGGSHWKRKVRDVSGWLHVPPDIRYQRYIYTENYYDMIRWFRICFYTGNHNIYFMYNLSTMYSNN